ncbi:MAG: hypothetical protein RRY07_01950 [Bacteroidaceae bacterium]
MKKILLRLRIEYASIWLLPALLAALYETNLFASGVFAGDAQTEYMLNTMGVLLAFLVVFLSLKLFSFKTVAVRLTQKEERLGHNAFVHWSEVRMSLLLAATLINLSVYYLTLTNTGLLCALMLLLASLFCWPKEIVAPIEIQTNDTEK